MSGSKDKRDQGDEQADGVEILPAKPQSLSQQLLIWFLVIMVGVLFGMGPAVMILRGRNATISSIRMLAPDETT